MQSSKASLRGLRLLNNSTFAGYAFIMPWLLGFIGLTILPMGISLYLSFTSYNIVSPPVFIGLQNYIRMFTADGRFISSVKATLYYVLCSVPLKIAFALAVALLLDRRARIFNLYRSIYYLPSLVGGSIAIAMMWKELFATNGIVNSFLGTFGLPSKTPWLGSPSMAIWVLILLTVWQFGSSMIIFAAGLKQIPHTYYEAAEIDGASGFQSLLYITLPALSPVIFFNVIMQIIFSFMAFTQAYIITGGGPLDSTLFYSLYIYQKAIQYREMGYGCAMSWILLLLIGIFTAIVFKSSSYWVFYESAKD